MTTQTGVVPLSYLVALAHAGADAVLLANNAEQAAIDAHRFDALLLTGGADVDPTRYGEEPHERTIVADADRDEYEIALVREARTRDVPVLAVCRGLQVVNVALGGTLSQHVPEVVGETIRHRVMDEPGTVHGHEVRVDAGSFLERVVGSEPFETTSRHHQAADTVAPGLRCTARTADGVIEALEAPDAEFFLAVQWHPELMAGGATSTRLFGAFVAAAAGRGQRTKLS